MKTILMIPGTLDMFISYYNLHMISVKQTLLYQPKY